MRYAIYFAPAPDSALAQTAASWLGRDAFSGLPLPHAETALDSTTVSDITSSPRRYGFHATLKAPFRLAPDRSETDLIAAFERFAFETPAFSVPEMIVGNLDGFFAIVPRAEDSPLNAFADRAVTAFEPFRAPLTQADIARRNPDQLSPAEHSNLLDWGYPYVFESFRFHMTLTNRIAERDRPVIAAELESLFVPVLPRPFPIDGLALFVEPERGAPFKVLRYASLPSAADRKTA